jgi:hypothetical protein
MNLSCGVADQVSLGAGRRAEYEARAEAGKIGLSVASIVLLSCVKRKEGGKRARDEGRGSYTPRKRRLARARALPDVAVAVF